MSFSTNALQVCLQCELGPLRLTIPPIGYPEPGRTTILDKSQLIDLDNVQLDGGAVVKLLTISVDPYLRGKMNEKSDYEASRLIPAFYKKGETLLIYDRTPLKLGNRMYYSFCFDL